MSPKVQSILEQALSLPPEQQLELIDALDAAAAESGLRPFDEEFLAEIERRSAEYDAGRSKTNTWDEVKAEARRRIQP